MCIETKVVVEPPELSAATGLLSGRFGVAVVPLCYFTEVLAAGIVIVDFELRRKGLCETFGLWICVLR
ncbi:uncharacterized protein DS421_10g298730 [Arachis hypogaea]|nr:uncharacterized protein DS421_10g298710 [Arachis hypogaea]QHO15880.1 uncharacterized protein DS421_10g298730 [Arachis hypogaea]